jgi:arylsulfatase A-like enzyme
MKTRQTAIVGCLTLCSVAFGQDPPKPNIVVFFTDDQSWDSVGFAGGDVFTPMKDSLSSEGITFTNAHVPTTVCSPSRYSLLTGKYPGRCSADRFMDLFPPGNLARIENNVELTLGEWHLGNLLQQLGYKTGFVGKSHIMEHIAINNINNWHRLGLDTYPANADPKYNTEVNDKMKHNHNIYRNIVKSYGFDYADGIYMGNLAHLNNQHLNVHNLEWTIGKALDFIEHEKDNPFFLYFSTTLNHGPYPWAYNNGVYPNSFSADPGYTGEGYVLADYSFMPSRSEILVKTTQAGYNERTAYTLWMDEGIRAIFNHLRKLDILDNTMIIFLPDHGSWRHGKATCYDFGLKVPSFAYWKEGIHPGTVFDGLISSLDIAPTLLELAGHNQIDTLELDGYSLSDLLLDGVGAGHESLYGELGYARSVKTKDWKYIAVRYPDEIQSLVNEGATFPSFQNEIIRQPYLTANAHLGYHAARQNPLYFETDQLFDLQNDPEETVNVFDQYPEVVQQMKSMLSRYLSTFDNRPFGEFTFTRESRPYPARFPNPLNKSSDISHYTSLSWKSEMFAN